MPSVLFVHHEADAVAHVRAHHGLMGKAVAKGRKVCDLCCQCWEIPFAVGGGLVHVCGDWFRMGRCPEVFANLLTCASMTQCL